MIPEVNSADDVIRVLKRAWPNASLKDFDGVDPVKWYRWATGIGRLQFSNKGTPYCAKVEIRIA